jgi:hypothetical protein
MPAQKGFSIFVNGMCHELSIFGKHDEVFLVKGDKINRARSGFVCKTQESLLLSMFHGTEFRYVFSSAEWFGTKFQEFCFNFVPRYGIPSIFLFRGMGSERNSEIFVFRVTGGIPSE